MNTISTQLEKEAFAIPEEVLKNKGKSEFLRSLFVTSKELKTLNFFWIGIILYTLGYTLSVTEKVNGSLCQLIQIFGLFLFIPATIQLVQFKFESKYLQILFVLYYIWISTIIGRGLEFDYYNIKLMLFEAYEGIFLYFVPIILLFPKNLLFYKKAFDAVIIIAFLGIIYNMLFIGDILNRGSDEGKGFLEMFSKTLAVPAGFILLTFIYHPARRKLLAIFILGLTALLAVYRARRSLILMAVNPLIFAYLLHLITSKKKILVIFFSIIIALFLALFIESFVSNNEGLFSYLMERGTDDTRTGVEECLFADMEPMDWIVGKGMKGEYYCPNIEVDAVTDYRTGIESDYLHLILKGGIINLALVLLIMLPAVFKGLFLSNNLLSKAAAVWVLFYLLYLYPSPVTKFNLNYILVWISIGICYSSNIRRMPENLVKSYFRAEIEK